MRRLVVVIGLVSALAVAAAASGCGGQAQAGATAPPKVANSISRPWTLRAVRDHGRVIVIRYTEGDCWGAAQARTTETQASVTIELLQFHSPGPGACPLFLLNRDLQVHLQAPLGHRRLIHARVG
jgi:hypothetical protein